MLNFLKDRMADLKADAARYARDRDFGEGVMAVAAVVAHADGKLEGAEKDAMRKVCRAMGLNPAEFGVA